MSSRSFWTFLAFQLKKQRAKNEGECSHMGVVQKGIINDI